MKLFSRHEKQSNKNEDMGNLVNSMFNSKPLYDELKIKCHPDLFLDDGQKDVATKLFQKLQKSKYDINAMKTLKPEIDALFKQR